MSKKSMRKRPTDMSYDSDDDLLREDVSGVSSFSKTKIEEEDIDEDALLGISGDNNKPVVYEFVGDEEVGEGDIFQIIDPDESTAFDEGTDLGLGGNQPEQEVLDYEDTIQEDLNDVVFNVVKTEVTPMEMSRPSTMSSAGSKDRTRPESDSDEDKDDHRARFKSERKMISLKSSKYAKPIPETLEVTPEMQEEINKFENKVPVKQRLGQKGNQKRGQNQRQRQGQFGPRFSGNQGRGGPRMNNIQRPQRPQIQQQTHFTPRQPQRGPIPRFPHEITITTTQDPPGNQIRQAEPGPMLHPPGPVPGPRPHLMQEPRPLLDDQSRPNVHFNPHFRGPVPVSQPFSSQPQPFPPGQPFPGPHPQPDRFPRPAWLPQNPSPTPGGYPPPQTSQPPFSGPQLPYPPASAAFSPRPDAPRPLIPTSMGPRGPHPQHPNIIPQNTPPRPNHDFRPPYPGPHGGSPGPQHLPQPHFQHPRFSTPEPRPEFNHTPNQHPQFRPMVPPEQRPPSPLIVGGPVRPQVEQQIRPMVEQQIRPLIEQQVRPQQVKPQFEQQVRPPIIQQEVRPQGGNIQSMGGQIRPQGRQIRPQVGFKRPQVTGNQRRVVGRGQQSPYQTAQTALQRLQQSRQVRLPKKPQGFNPTPNNLTPVQGNIIPVVNSRGVKRRSTETPEISPAKQIKKEPEPVPMEVVDPELQRALDEQKRQREAIKAKKEQNRLALANKRRMELEEKLAKQGMTIEDLDRRLEQGQKISVLGKQYPNTSTNPPSSQYTNLVQVPAASVGRGQNIQVQAAGAGRGQNVQVQAAGVGRGQNVQVQATGVGRGQNTQVQAGGGGRGQAVQVQARGGGRGQAAQVQARGGGRGQAAQVQARGGGRGQAAQVQARGGGRGQVVQVQAGGSGRGQIVEGPAQAVGRGQNTSMPFRGGGKGQRGRGFGRGHKKGAGPQQVNTGHQQGQQPQNPGHLQKKQQGQNQPNVGQGQLKPLTVVRKDNKGGVLQTYNALPTKDAHGKTVFKLKIQDQGVQKNVQTTVMPTRTVVAGSGRGGQGHTERQVIAHNTPQTPRTVVASSNNPRTIVFTGTNPHLRSRKIAVEGLTSTTQEAKLISMVNNIGGHCETIKIIPQQRRAILTFQTIEMATKFVKKYNRTMVDLTKIQVKEIPE